MQTIFVTLFCGLTFFLICLILLQRGRGGGLAGAFGGMGGQSAFGTKAGDVFTKITVVTAALLFVLCVFSTMYLKREQSSLDVEKSGSSLLKAPVSAPAPQE